MVDVRETRVSVIGMSATGRAVASGLAKAGCGVVAAYTADTYTEQLDGLNEDGIELISDNAKAIVESEAVMFALKPDIILGVVKEHAGLLKGKLCISLSAAVTLDMLMRAAPEARWARAMTNLSAALNCGFTGITRSNTTTDDDLAWMKRAFELLGEVEEVIEKSLDATRWKMWRKRAWTH